METIIIDSADNYVWEAFIKEHVNSTVLSNDLHLFSFQTPILYENLYK